MPLDIGRNGIVQRHEGGKTTIYRPGGNGGAGAEIEVSLGEPSLVFRLHGTHVAPGELASRSLEDAGSCAVLQRWAASKY